MLRTTLRHIEVFVATAQKGNVTQAAALIGLTQSAASMALADFENQLGTRLFDRVGKRLSLNDDGRALYPRAVQMIDWAQEMAQMFQRDERAVDLHLGASSTIGNYLLPKMIGGFNASRPGSRIRLEVSNTQKIIDAVRHFELDIGFVEGPCVTPELDTIFWQHDELAIFSAPDHSLARQQELSVSSLRQADWILRERGSGTREVVEQLLTSQLGTVGLSMELGGTEAIKRAVESGLGISCLPKIAVTEAVRLGTLVCLPTPMLRLTRAFHILLHKQKYRTAGILGFLELCQLTRGRSY
ncbi:LysR family transcriptional regulator [Noviherbaspirillum pedocola]|uniref:LysR family transcriptional regulator n=1 Tax=Noviherbaspirillum pedocola TaxID=2801341 RepID=A0A934W9K3_9BURK|nr:LysR family transcriptional regulator [Noviherbaspirillum pedocola]MBK4739030.1 LysR family transcriptional regulator [Noviherbaspirillum pedocola]